MCTASWSIAYEFHITHVEYGPALIHRNKNAHRTVSTVFHSNSPTVNRCNASHQIHCYTFYFHIYDDQDASHDLQNFRLCCWIISRSVCMEYYPCCIRMMHLSFFWILNFWILGKWHLLARNLHPFTMRSLLNFNLVFRSFVKPIVKLCCNSCVPGGWHEIFAAATPSSARAL